MVALRSLVVRIYRQEPECIAGVIEIVGTGEVVAFHSLDDLCQVIGRCPSSRRSNLYNINGKETEE